VRTIVGASRAVVTDTGVKACGSNSSNSGTPRESRSRERLFSSLPAPDVALLLRSTNEGRTPHTGDPASPTGAPWGKVGQLPANLRLARAFYARISGAGKQMNSISLRLSLFVGVHAGLLLGFFLLA
jgi:hypothetical protein